jgi:hypothetical protein
MLQHAMGNGIGHGMRNVDGFRSRGGRTRERNRPARPKPRGRDEGQPPQRWGCGGWLMPALFAVCGYLYVRW